MSKIRLDQYLCQNGLVQSRERAKALIMSGIVFVDEQKVDKAGEMINPDAKVEVRGHDIGYKDNKRHCDKRLTLWAKELEKL